MQKYQHYIDGPWTDPDSTKWFDTVNPYTGDRAVSFTSPFGGYKRSGVGRESGLEAIKEYLQVKSVWIATQSSVANPFILR